MVVYGVSSDHDEDTLAEVFENGSEDGKVLKVQINEKKKTALITFESKEGKYVIFHYT